MKARPYRTPDGYMESLEKRLSTIPVTGHVPLMWTAIKPYLALAACLVVTLVFVSVLVKKPSRTETYAELTPDDIVNYLIDTYTPIDNIGEELE